MSDDSSSPVDAGSPHSGDQQPDAPQHTGLSGPLNRFISQSTEWIYANPGTTLLIVALLTAVSAGISARFLTFKTDRADLIRAEAEFHARWLHYVEQFGSQSEILVVVEGERTADIKAAIDNIGQSLEAQPELFEKVMYRFDPSGLKPKSLQYLSPAELTAIAQQLEQHRDILDGKWDRAGIEAHAQQLTLGLRQLNQLSAAAELPSPLGNGGDAQQLMGGTIRFCRSLNQFDPATRRLLSPWPEFLSGRSPQDASQFEPRYQLNDAGTMGFLLVSPTNTQQSFGGANRSLEVLRGIIVRERESHPEITLGLTGIPILESDEMQRSQEDMTWASIISFLGVGLITLIGFRGLRHPFLSLLTLLIGIVWCLGYTTIVVGHLNILSVSFAAILIGLGIDFAIHYLAKYLELRHHGETLRSGLRNTSTSVGTGIITAAVTTALAFFCASFTSFLGVAELGIIAGGGVLICAAATFFVLPALITFADRRVEPKKLPTPFEGRLLTRAIQNYPGTVCFVTLAAIIFIGCQGFQFTQGRVRSRVAYDSNLLHLQAEGLESVKLQEHVFQESEGSLLFAVSLASSPADVKDLKAKFSELPSVARVEELATLMPQYPPAETQLLVQGIHAHLDRLSDLPGQFPQLDPGAIGKALEELYIELQKSPHPDAAIAKNELDAFLDRLSAQELGDQITLLGAYQQSMLTALHRQFEALESVSNPEPVAPVDFPREFRTRFLSAEGEWLIRVYPKVQVWDEEPLEQFVQDVRSVDPNVTGTPLQNYEAARQIKQSYKNASIYALGVIILTLLIDSLSGTALFFSLTSPLAVMAFALFSLEGATDLGVLWLAVIYVAVAVVVGAVFDFKSVRNTFLALGPPVLGLFMTFGLLGLFHVDLNPANLIVLPLILGIGVDDGVHVIHDFRCQSGTYRTSPSTINAITLTSLTSMIGFGSMMVAAHQGLVSLGIVLVVGVGSCLFVSLVTLPAILTLIGTDSSDSVAATATEETTDQDADVHVLPFSSSADVQKRDAAS
ncbi:MAG: MMPL family transporter [Planctomycetaceae bacterium]